MVYEFLSLRLVSIYLQCNPVFHGICKKYGAQWRIITQSNYIISKPYLELLLCTWNPSTVVTTTTYSFKLGRRLNAESWSGYVPYLPVSVNY